MRRALAAAGVLAAALGGLALLGRGPKEARERVDLHFEDGSMISLASTTDEAARLLPLARRVLADARA